MNELKATTVYDAYWKANSVGEGTGIQIYLKSEADKVIAELEESHKIEVEQLLMEIVKLKEKLDLYKRGWAESDKVNAYLYAELRHANYKRCLEMASDCRLRARWFGDNSFYKKEQWALKWHRRWLELAKKFKETK